MLKRAFIAQRLGQLTILGLILAGCGGPLQISVKDKWAKSVRNYALIPVYPMREDVFIGTLRVKRKVESNNYLNSRSLGYLDMSRALISEETGKPAYGKSGSSEVVTADNKGKLIGLKWGQPQSILAPGSGGASRLRLAALPGISMVRLTEADFAHSGIVGLISQAIAGQSKRRAHLDLNLKGIETMEISDVEALRVMRQEVMGKLMLDRNFTDAICASAVALDAKLPDVQVTMVTRVFYARGIQYSWGKTASAALGATSGKGDLPDLENATSDQAGKPAAVTLKPIAPGSSIGLSSSSKDSLTQNEVFERPLAFGVQAMSVEPAVLGMTCDEKTGLSAFKPGKREQLITAATNMTTTTATTGASATTATTSTTLTGPDGPLDCTSLPTPKECTQ